MSLKAVETIYTIAGIVTFISRKKSCLASEHETSEHEI